VRLLICLRSAALVRYVTCVYVAVTFTCYRYVRSFYTFVYVGFGWFVSVLVFGYVGLRLFLRSVPRRSVVLRYVPLLPLRSFAFALVRSLPFGYWFPFRLPFVYVRSVRCSGLVVVWLRYVVVMVGYVSFGSCCCLVRSLVCSCTVLPVFVYRFGLPGLVPVI
jgi:hypothetical protein